MKNIIHAEYVDADLEYKDEFEIEENKNVISQKFIFEQIQNNISEYINSFKYKDYIVEIVIPSLYNNLLLIEGINNYPYYFSLKSNSSNNKMIKYELNSEFNQPDYKYKTFIILEEIKYGSLVRKRAIEVYWRINILS